MSGEKTEEPTQKRLDDARRRGDVARSRELVSFASLAAAVVALAATADSVTSRLLRLVERSVSRLGSRELPSPASVLVEAASEMLRIVGPVLLAMAVVSAIVAFLDVGPVFAPSRLLPKPERLDPVNGAKQLFGKERRLEFAKSLVALVALVSVASLVLFELLPSLPRLAGLSPERGLSVAGSALATLLRRFLVALAALAAVDFFLSRKQFLEGLRMSKDEVKREYKEADGDPHQKAARARMHREILEHSVLEGVRSADVLVVNPTHLAIALKFDADSDQNAPMVVGKGEDDLARAMIDAAREAGVPVMRDIPLARTLYELELGDEIPEELFEAVAAVLRAAWAERDEAS